MRLLKFQHNLSEQSVTHFHLLSFSLSYCLNFRCILLDLRLLINQSEIDQYDCQQSTREEERCLFSKLTFGSSKCLEVDVSDIATAVGLFC